MCPARSYALERLELSFGVTKAMLWNVESYAFENALQSSVFQADILTLFDMPCLVKFQHVNVENSQIFALQLILLGSQQVVLSGHELNNVLEP